MNIYGGIDGTGPYNDQVYSENFAESNVNRFSRLTGWSGGSFYDRGPGADGMSTGGRADRMAGRVSRAYQNALQASESDEGSAQPRIFLAGYSRGGAAVANVAHTLNDQGIPVHCLLLFDAVDRSLTIWRSEVPSNVNLCFHAKRSPLSNSRNSFGNCSTSAQPGVIMASQEFLCTHGAMGGVPWPTAESDGFIHERDVTVASEGTWSAGSLGRAAAAFGTSLLTGSLLAGAAAGDLYDSASRTNITVVQEAAGNVAVWNWMHGNLVSARR